jgi:HK97 gp10 family phage protein
MALLVTGSDGLVNDLDAIIEALSPESIKRALEAGAEPVARQAKANAKGKIAAAIRAGKIKTGKGGRKSISIGVHRDDWTEEEYYPPYVEFGHGGPHPAGAHPYLRPAFDATKDEAYSRVRDTLKEESTKG